MKFCDKNSVLLHNTKNTASCMFEKDMNIMSYKLQTWISLNPKALPIVVAVRSLPPLPRVVIAPDLHPCYFKWMKPLTLYEQTRSERERGKKGIMRTSRALIPLK